MSLFVSGLPAVAPVAATPIAAPCTCAAAPARSSRSAASLRSSFVGERPAVEFSASPSWAPVFRVVAADEDEKPKRKRGRPKKSDATASPSPAPSSSPKAVEDDKTDKRNLQKEVSKLDLFAAIAKEPTEYTDYIICPKCAGQGCVPCPQCEGTGVNSEDKFQGRFKKGEQCWLCIGKKVVGCSDCTAGLGDS
eukprot:tig00000808_g4434.t1